MRNRLTVKQEKFCINYFQSGNATQAAIIAGYSPKTAYVIATENLNKPAIKARMTELQAIPASKAILNVQKRKELLSEFATEIIESKYGIVRDGNLRAIDLLNKMDKLYAENNIDIQVGIQIKEVEVRLSNDYVKQ
jgi:phage terminase small subunit